MCCCVSATRQVGWERARMTRVHWTQYGSILWDGKEMRQHIDTDTERHLFACACVHAFASDCSSLPNVRKRLLCKCSEDRVRQTDVISELVDGLPELHDSALHDRLANASEPQLHANARLVWRYNLVCFKDQAPSDSHYPQHARLGASVQATWCGGERGHTGRCRRYQSHQSSSLLGMRSGQQQHDN